MSSRRFGRPLDPPAPASQPALPAATVSLDAPEIDASPFLALGLSRPVVRALLDEGYATPTPIQAQVIPHALARRDVLGCAPTGTGKTAAFVVPLLEALSGSARDGRIRALVVAPTRELAAQIAERVSVYGRHQGARHAVVYGGVGQHGQEVALRRSPDVLIATPGRLLDLMQQGLVRLDAVTHLVLDEADRMLDMGFIHDVRRICAALPARRQTLLFSATMPADIQALAGALLVDPVRVTVTPEVTTAEKVAQSVVFVARREKRAVLERMLRGDGVERALVFTRTKHGANRLSEQLGRSGIRSAACSSRRTWPPAASTSTASRTSSTSICPTWPRATCTASGARGAPARSAAPSRSATRSTRAACCATSSGSFASASRWSPRTDRSWRPRGRSRRRGRC
jgi:ATP-dependent RNA helicase RhlE